MLELAKVIGDWVDYASRHKYITVFSYISTDFLRVLVVGEIAAEHSEKSRALAFGHALPVVNLLLLSSNLNSFHNHPTKGYVGNSRSRQGIGQAHSLRWQGSLPIDQGLPVSTVEPSQVFKYPDGIKVRICRCLKCLKFGDLQDLLFLTNDR
jgi:hypothetical protein